jgi:cytochrome c oxidase subunit IV
MRKFNWFAIVALVVATAGFIVAVMMVQRFFLAR